MLYQKGESLKLSRVISKNIAFDFKSPEKNYDIKSFIFAKLKRGFSSAG
jgi:hypothetical protein